MSGTTWIRGVLLAFVVISIAYLGLTEFRGPAADPQEEAGETEQSIDATDASGARRSTSPLAAETPRVASSHKVIAYYFHNTQRCKTCLKIERLAEEALRSQFPTSFEDGVLEWRSVNMELSPNEHFVTDFELVTSSLVLVDMRDGDQRDWVNMKEVWDLVHAEEREFKAYVTRQARLYLESDS